MKISEIKQVRRKRRRQSVRRRLRESGSGVRLSVHRSLKHIYAQVVDDNQGKSERDRRVPTTVCSARSCTTWSSA